MNKLKITIISVLSLISAFMFTSCDALNESSITEDLPIFAPERWAMAGAVTAEGLLVVFSALGILFLATALFGVIFGKKSKKAAENKSEAPAAPVAPAVGKNNETDDGELAAVIAAAVAAYIDSDEELSQEFESGFRVVSFKRTGRK